MRALSCRVVARQTDAPPGQNQHFFFGHHPRFWPPKLPVFRRQPVQASSVCQMGGLGHEVTRPDRLVGSQGAYAKKHWSVRVNQQLPHSLSLPQADTLSGDSGALQSALQRLSQGQRAAHALHVYCKAARDKCMPDRCSRGLKAAQPSLSSLDQPCRLPALCQNLSGTCSDLTEWLSGAGRPDKSSCGKRERAWACLGSG